MAQPVLRSCHVDPGICFRLTDSRGWALKPTPDSKWELSSPDFLVNDFQGEKCFFKTFKKCWGEDFCWCK